VIVATISVVVGFDVAVVVAPDFGVAVAAVGVVVAAAN